MMEIQVEAFLEELRSRGDYTERTIQAYASDLHRFLDYLTGRLGRSPRLGDYDAEAIAAFLQAEQEAGRQPNTLMRRRASLRRFARYLLARGQIGVDPTQEREVLPEDLRAIAKGDAEGRLLAPAEIEAVREALDGVEHPRTYRDAALFSLLLETGFSLAMVVSLDLDDLDVEGKRVRVPAGRNGQQVWLPIDESVDLLKRYLGQGRADLSPDRSENALFVSQMGGRMSRQGVWQTLKNWGRRAGLEGPLSPRKVRHTAAMRLFDSGLGPEEVQKYLGHANILSTRALYRRLCDARSEKMAEKEEVSRG